MKARVILVMVLTFCMSVLTSCTGSCPLGFDKKSCDASCDKPCAMSAWKNVLADDLSNCTFKPGSWEYVDGVLTRKGGGDIWTKDVYGDFELSLEFKLSKGCNSGVFIRTADIKNWLHTGIEIQMLDSHGKEKPGKHDCGAIYDCLEPSKNMVNPAGEWNQLLVKADDNMIYVTMNGEQIIEMNLDEWLEAHKNKDDTKNKFNIAYKDMARAGVFGFQDHGHAVWYRNIKVKSLN